MLIRAEIASLTSQLYPFDLQQNSSATLREWNVPPQSVIQSAFPPSTGGPSQPIVVSAKPLEHEMDVRPQFDELCKKWKSERHATSFSSAMAMHPAYQRIIGMGNKALPLILTELQKELDHWFWALKAISGEDPVPSECRGKMAEMANAWLNWGRARGYVR